MYVAATMLAMAEEELLDIDEPISRWLPDLPDADQATPRMLASMTSGYPDHLANADFLTAQAAKPFRAWTEAELLAYSAESPRLFAPGENWDYSHAGYIFLGHVLEAAGGSSFETLLSKYVLDPLNLEGTVMQTPLFGGYQAAVATLPQSQSPIGSVTVSVSVVPGPQSYTAAEWDGALANYTADLATELGRQIVPQNPPPVPKPAP